MPQQKTVRTGSPPRFPIGAARDVWQMVCGKFAWECCAVLAGALLPREARAEIKGEPLMELRNNIKLLNYTRKYLLNETDGILPFPVRPQKPARTGKAPLPLPRQTPREAGVPAAALDALLRGLAGAEGGTHACLVLRRGSVVCEAGYAPYSTRLWHVTHSMCKSVTGTAVGMLIDEGLLSLDERVCDIFPEKCGLLTGRRTRAITVRHLVTMKSGVAFKEAGAVLESDWVKAFFDADVLFEPGSTFDYNSMNSYLLSAIIRKKTGVGLMEYLRPRLFEPLGFGDTAWETCPQGIEKGGWGLYVYLEDLAKLGQLYLRKGMWTLPDGTQRRLLSEAWVDAATRPDTVCDNGEEYGYQLWPHSANGTYLFNGMFGQYVVVAPQAELVVAVNAGAANLFTLSRSFGVISTFVQAVCDAPDTLVQAPDDDARLAYTLAHLRFRQEVPPLPAAQKAPWYARLRDALFPPRAPAVPGPIPPNALSRLARPYAAEPNRAGLCPAIIACMEDWYTKGVERIAFDTRGGLTVLWTESGVTHRLPVGLDGAAAECALDLGGNLFAVSVLGRFTADEDDNPVLKLTVCFLESSSARLIKLKFLPDGSLMLRLDEAPSLAAAMQGLWTTLKNPPPGMELFKDMDYLQYLIRRVCTPIVRCQPQPAPAD